MELFEELEKEHKNIRHFINSFDKTLYEINSGHPVGLEVLNKYLLFIRYYIDKLHHGKEEEILFPAAHHAGHLKVQGEKCMLFFDIFSQQKHLEKIKNELKSSDNISLYQYKKVLEPIFIDRSFLEVPLEDHQTGYYALEIMCCELEKVKKDSNHGLDRFVRIAQIYLSMLHYHLRKEDECLFVALKKRFSESEINKLNQACLEFNNKFDFSLIPGL